MLQILFSLIFAYSPPICTPNYYRLALLPIDHTQWLIHGLWIEQCKECSSCSYPTECQKENYNVTLLRPIYKQLFEEWYPGGNPEQNKLLFHEWTKHGTCFNTSQLEYFNKTIFLFDTIVAKYGLENCSGHECHFTLDKNFSVLPN